MNTAYTTGVATPRETLGKYPVEKVALPTPIPVVADEPDVSAFFAARPGWRERTEEGIRFAATLFPHAEKISLEVIDGEPEEEGAHLSIVITLPGSDWQTAEIPLRRLHIEWQQQQPISYQRRIVVDFWMTGHD